MNKNFVIILSLFIISCSNKKTSTKDLISKEIDTLKYSYKGFNNGSNLLLLSNKKFEYIDYFYGCTGGGRTKKVIGKYNVDDTKLILIPTNINLIIRPYNLDGETKNIDTKYGIDSLKIKTKYDIIKWGNYSYLLSEEFSLIGKEYINDYHRFSKNYNSGYEPKKSGRYLKMTPKESDTLQPELNLSTLPQKWRKLFLSEPINASINKISIEVSKRDNELKIWKTEINKGLNNNIRKGMTFSDQTGDFSIEIDSVMKQKSFGKEYIYDFEENVKIKKGDLLKTKWK